MSGTTAALIILVVIVVGGTLTAIGLAVRN